MIVLVLNCGSSSIKYQVMDLKDAQNYKLLASGLVERIGASDSLLKHKPFDREKVEVKKPMPDHGVGISSVLEILVHPQHGVLKSLKEVDAVGHRVVHGGEFFVESQLIDAKVKQAIEACSDLAPLHNPANLKGITSVEAVLPNVPQVAVFDTSFHQSMPAKAYLYGIPYRYYEEYKVRRYGFHGTSHRYVAQKACDLLGLNIKEVKIVTCHLGNGASIASVAQGLSVDTSMGLTPVDGLMMGTRSGTIDPGVLFYIAEKEKLSLGQVSDIVNKQGGVLGISGLSSDMRDLHAATAEGNERAALSLEMYYHRVRKFIAAHAAAMGGVDVIVFTGGIGENDAEARSEMCAGLEFMGVNFDPKANSGVRGEDKVLSAASSRVKVVTITTNEELVIALDTMKIAKN